MRKVVIMGVALLVLANIPLLAGISKATVSGYYSVEKTEQYLDFSGPNTAIDIESTSMGLLMKGSSFTNLRNQLGFSYTARVGKTTEQKIDGSDEDVSDIPLRWDIGFYLACQQDVSYSTFIEAGAGFQFGIESETWTSGGSTYSWEMLSAYVAGYLELNYAVTATTFLNIGAQALIPFGGTVTVSSDNISLDSDIEMSGFAFVPYVGLSLAF
ncbi:MAG: hypothetical protein ACQ5SW_11785 [Sphaerochaetaceae bacterium]